MCIRDRLRRIHKQVGTTFVCVTHDQEEAMALSDRIAILKDGHIEQIGTPNELYDQPASEFVANFFGKCALWPLKRDTKDKTTAYLSDSNIKCKTNIIEKSGKNYVVIRPEFLQISSSDKNNGDKLKGKVLDILTKGASNQVTVEFRNKLVIDLNVPRKQKIPEIGGYVHVKLMQSYLHAITN